MKDWVNRTFPVHSDDDAEFFEFDRNGVRVQADLNLFLGRFGTAATPPTATALKAADPEDRLGWHRHFDAWVEQGIIQP